MNYMYLLVDINDDWHMSVNMRIGYLSSTFGDTFLQIKCYDEVTDACSVEMQQWHSELAIEPIPW